MANTFMFLPKPVTSLFFRRGSILTVTVGCLVVVKFDRAFVAVRLVAVNTLSNLNVAGLYDVVDVILADTEVPLTVVLARADLNLGNM